MVEAYLEAGGLRAKHYSDREALEKDCVDLANSETVFLVKGSRGARMETVVAALSAAG
jgi:UDP-N-acetylmuramyl pentapeptide synthase